jgi:hypothetical protein
MSKASKIGFIYKQDGVTKLWIKQVGVMSENYIYLFNSKSDQTYNSYYYLKNAQLSKKKDIYDKDKPFHLSIKNKINEVVFGFDKMETLDDWFGRI